MIPSYSKDPKVILKMTIYIGQKLFTHNHKRTIINSVIELACDLFVVKIKPTSRIR